MGPRASLDGRKISSPPGFDPGRPARSQSLYRLSYPASSARHKAIYILRVVLSHLCA